MGVIIGKWTCSKCGRVMTVIDLDYNYITSCYGCGSPRPITPRPAPPAVISQD